MFLCFCPKASQGVRERKTCAVFFQFLSYLLTSEGISEAEQNIPKRSVIAKKVLNLCTVREGACLGNPLNSAEVVDSTEMKVLC